jgi:hypothetical protein
MGPMLPGWGTRGSVTEHWRRAQVLRLHQCCSARDLCDVWIRRSLHINFHASDQPACSVLATGLQELSAVPLACRHVPADSTAESGTTRIRLLANIMNPGQPARDKDNGCHENAGRGDQAWWTYVGR